jgi:hypothetical protein
VEIRIRHSLSSLESHLKGKDRRQIFKLDEGDV